jgi:hypothetical protein
LGLLTSPPHHPSLSGGLGVILDTTNLLLTFSGLTGALTCLTLWKISHEETKKGRKLAWNLSFRKQRKRAKSPKRARSRVHVNQKQKRKYVKPITPQKDVDILSPQYNLPRDAKRDEESPYLEGEWKVIE